MIRAIMSVLLILCMISTPVVAADTTPLIKIGAAAVEVTPEQFPISVNGGFADRQATKAHDPLYARALVMNQGKQSLALVIVDSCMLPRELIDHAKAIASRITSIPTSSMLIAATHTHTAPTATSVFQSDPDPAYVTFLTGKIADAIVLAHKNMLPGELAVGFANEPAHLFNRRWKMKPGGVTPNPFGGTGDLVKMNPGHLNANLLEPAGPIDPELAFIMARSAFGKPVAVFGAYGLHYVGDRPPLSADYFGVFAEKVQSALKADYKEGQRIKFVGALFNGTSGDVNNINFKAAAVKAEPGERSRVVAESLANHAQATYESSKFTGDVILASAEEEIELKVRKPSEKELAAAQAILDAAQDQPLKTAEQVYARETVLLAKYPDTVKLKLQAHRIGDVIITAIPCETFTEIGLALKKSTPLKKNFTISLANGYNGYLPTLAQHKLGGYETWRARSSYLEVDAATKIVKVLEKLSKDVAAVK